MSRGLGDVYKRQDRIITAAGDIKTINYRQYENPRLEELAETILDAAAALKE